MERPDQKNEASQSKNKAPEQTNEAILRWRRDVAKLGLLHRISVGQASSQVRELFPLAPLACPRAGPATRLSNVVHRHNREFVEARSRTEVLSRRLFGLASSYKLLPQDVVNTAA